MWKEYLRLYINKLKNSSLYKEFLNNYFLISFFIVLGLLSKSSTIWLIILFIYCIYLARTSKNILIISLLIFGIIFIKKIIIDNNYYELKDNEIIGEVVLIETNEQGQKLIINNKNTKVLAYDYNYVDINYGDIVKIKGELLFIEDKRVKNGFDYKLYLKRKNINGIIRIESIEKKGRKFNIGFINKYFNRYIDKNFKDDIKVFINAFIIGNKDGMSDDLKDSILDNGILHLFSISGLHIGLFISFLNRILKLFTKNAKKIYFISTCFLGIYLVLTNFSPSIVRASMLYVLNIINKQIKLSLSTLDILSIIFIFLLTINPNLFYDLGFALSFLSATTIVLSSELVKRKNKYIQVFYLSLFTTIASFPIVVNINNKINILSPITNVIFIEIVSFLILPLSFIVLVIPIFSNVYNLIISFFIKTTFLFSDYFRILIFFPTLNTIAIIIYYLLIYSIIKNAKLKKIKYSFIISLLLYLFILNNSVYIKQKTEIHFLDLYNGESTLILDPKNNCVALIDTGDGKNAVVTNYLKKIGVFRINYLILTHDHLDHNGEARKIISELKVDNIVVNEFDTSMDYNNVIKVSKGDEILCGKNSFKILNPDINNLNENDNSIIIYSKINRFNFLFLGDATRIIEEKLINLNLNVDIIKIAHHGSNTSTSPKLIDNIRPTYAIIMTGRIERFGFPHIETINTLNNYNVIVHRTDLDYSIILHFEKEKYWFEKQKNKLS